MSARFACNFTVLLLGAILVIFLYAFSVATADWLAVGVGAVAIVLALSSFASANQGTYQRIADVLICALGAWAVVAARVMDDRGMWLVFGAGAGLAIIGALGLLIREVELSRGLQVGHSRIGPDAFAQLSALQRDAEARP